MKRLIGLFLCAIAVPAFALTATPRPGDRIGVLRMADRFADRHEQTISNIIQNDLRGELRDMGFSALDTRVTYNELLRQGPGDADYYVEVVSSYAANRPVGAVGAAVEGVAVEIAGRTIVAAIMLPFVQYGQYRSAAHAVAHQAALRIAGR